jgi:hypothetical protein
MIARSIGYVTRSEPSWAAKELALKETMKIPKSMILIAGLFLTLLTSSLSVAKSAARSVNKTSPDSLVAELYRQSARNRSPFFQTRSRALVNNYFDKRLGDLIWKDAIRSKGEVGAIDGDPLYNAQDMEIKNFVIHKAEVVKVSTRNTSGVVAEVKVNFENFGKKEEIVFILRPATGASGWRIANIKYNDGTDLLAILESGN